MNQPGWHDSCEIWTHTARASGTWVHPLRPLGQTVLPMIVLSFFSTLNKSCFHDHRCINQCKFIGSGMSVVTLISTDTSLNHIVSSTSWLWSKFSNIAVPRGILGVWISDGVLGVSCGCIECVFGVSCWFLGTSLVWCLVDILKMSCWAQLVFLWMFGKCLVDFLVMSKGCLVDSLVCGFLEGVLGWFLVDVCSWMPFGFLMKLLSVPCWMPRGPLADAYWVLVGFLDFVVMSCRFLVDFLWLSCGCLGDVSCGISCGIFERN